MTESVKKLHLSPVAQAWEDWQKTREGQNCLADAAEGKYLRNRLWYAFMAGAEAARRVGATQTGAQ